MKNFSFPSVQPRRFSGGVAAGVATRVAVRVGALVSVVVLGLTLQISPAQAQNPVPAPNGNNKTQWVAVGDQIVPASAVIGLAAFGATPDATTGKFGRFSFGPNARKWPGGRVAYSYDANVNAAKQAVFESAIREWEKFANLRFTRRVAEANYIVVTSTANDSNSPIGMIGGPQILNLADGADQVIALRQVAHALGFINEHSRPDRDTFVTINTVNIQDGKAAEFDKITGALNQTAYDFDSIMHFSRNEFSKNGEDTITANPPYARFQDTMGRATRLSQGDKDGMVAVYGPPGENAKGIITPDFPKTNETLTAKPAGNGTPASYSYTWFRNGRRLIGETTNMLDLSVPGNGDKGDRITVRVDGPDEVGVDNSEFASVRVINTAPVVTPNDAATPLATVNTKPLTGQLTGTDDDNDAFTFLVVAPPENGTLALNPNGSYTYTPNAGFVGTDGFKAAANDGASASLPVTFSIRVTRGNRAPVFEDMSLRASLNAPFQFSLGATDADNDFLFYDLVGGTLPDGLTLDFDGTISGTPTQIQTTTATITVDDFMGGTATADITIEVKLDNRPPSVRATIAPTAPKTRDTVTVTATVTNSTEGEVTTVYNFMVNGESVQSGSSNTLDLAVAGQGDKGDVISCEVTATNAGGATASATVQTTVVNSVPFARGGTGFANADEPAVFDAASFGIDTDSEPLKVNIVGGPANGTVSMQTGADGKLKLVYRSRPAFKGTDVIRFTVSDSEATSSNTSEFAIGVRFTAPPVNRAPEAGDTTVNAFIGVPFTKSLLGRDIDGDPITFRLVNNARFGQSRIARDGNGVWKLFYTSLNRLYGPDRVTYVAVDNKGKESNVATIAINFINRAPVAKASRITVASGAPISQYLFADDPDKDPISFRLVNNARYGKSEIKRDAQGAWRVYYQSLANYIGEDRINFIAIDAAGKESAPATIQLNVVRPASSPSAGGALQSGDAPSGGKS